MKIIESIDISSYGASEDLVHVGTITNLALAYIKVKIASVGEAIPYINGEALDANNHPFHAICFLCQESEDFLRKHVEQGMPLKEALKITSVEPTDYVKGVGVTFQNCRLSGVSA